TNEDAGNAIKIHPSFVFSRTKLTEQDHTILTEAPQAEWFNRLTHKLRGLYGSMGHVLSSALYRTGRKAELTRATGSQTINSAVTEFSVAVDAVHALHVGLDVSVWASNGSAIGNSVNGVVTSLGPERYGAGTVKIKFPEYGSSFTIPVGGIIGLVNSDSLFLNGLDEMIGTASHPRTEGSNVGLDMDEYKSHVRKVNG